MKHREGRARHRLAVPPAQPRSWPLVAAAVASLMAFAAVVLNSQAGGAITAAGLGSDSAQELVELYGGDVGDSQPAGLPGDTRTGSDEAGTAPAETPDSIDESGAATSEGGAAAAEAVPYVPVRDSSITSQVSTVSDSPARPVRLVIPDLGIDMAIGAVGVQEDGQMEIPDDVDEIGWYKFGSVPGASSGTTVLASHVDSWAEGVGPFARLRNQAPVGTWINVYRSDGSVRSYTVIDNRMIHKSELPVDTLFNRTGEHRLVLVTCGGTFLRDIGSYTDNIVVTAVPAGR